MPKDVLGLSTALSGLFSYFVPSALTFSALFCLLPREKVDMERAGRDAEGSPLAGGCFSGEKEVASVADGVLLCED